MKTAIAPLFLVEGATVTMKQEEVTADHPAECILVEPESKKDGQHAQYQIRVFLPVVRELYRESWVRECCTFEELVLAFELHEAAHIRYHTFAYTAADPKTALFELLDNMLDDSRIEFCLSGEFPAFARYLSYALGATRSYLHTRTVVAAHTGELERLKRRVGHLFFLARFGIVTRDMEPELRDIALPLILSSTRGTRENTVFAARFLATYLLHQDKELQKAVARATITHVALGKEEVCGLSGEQVLPSAIRASVNEMGERRANAGQHELVQKEQQNVFVEQVCREHRDALLFLHSSFRLLFSGVSQRLAFDGDLLPSRQMQAYLSAQRGEETADYALWTHVRPSSDIVLFGDVSGSTREMRVPYAAAKVLVLAALNGIEGVFPSAMDFSDAATWVCRPGEPLELSRVGPRCEYGTQPLTALSLLEREMVWRGKQHLAFWITDGDWVQSDETLRRIAMLEKEIGLISTIIHCAKEQGNILELRETNAYGVAWGHPIWHCTVETLPDVIFTVIRDLRGKAGLL